MTYNIMELNSETDVIEVNETLAITKGYYRGKYGYCEIATHLQGKGTYFLLLGVDTKDAPYFHESEVRLIKD